METSAGTSGKMFLACRRGKQTVFLEPSEVDKVHKALGVLADAVGRDEDQLALVYKQKMLDPSKTFKEQKVTHEGPVVDPLFLAFVYKKEDGEWEAADPAASGPLQAVPPAAEGGEQAAQ